MKAENHHQLQHECNNRSSYNIISLTVAADYVDLSSEDLLAPGRDRVVPVAFRGQLGTQRYYWNLTDPCSSLDTMTVIFCA